MSWAPQPEGLQTILQTLRESANAQDPQVQKESTMRLRSFLDIPDYPCYLVYIVALPDGDEHIRSVAALVLKNVASTTLTKWAPEVLEFVKQNIIVAHNDTAVLVRNAAGQVVVAILDVLGPVNWPDCLNHLITNLDAPEIDKQLGAFGVLERACEDYPRKFDVDISGTRPLDIMIPKFIVLSEHPNSKMRVHALTALSHFIGLNIESLQTNMEQFLSALFKRASDEFPDVRQIVCQCLVMLLGWRPETLLPVINDVSSFMLYSTQDKDENVALEACEFWLTFAEEPDLSDALRTVLPQLAPVLLNSMVYTEEDLAWLQGIDEEDANVPDKASDIKPKFYGGGSRSLEHDSGNAGGGSGNVGLKYGQEDEFEDDDDEYDYYEDDGQDWNLRKCAAAAFDVIAVRFSAELLQIVFPYLKDKLWSDDWKQRESGILALGAMAEGCIDALDQHLPSLIPYLVNCLNDQRPLVRSIVCWTIGRYSSWCTQPGMSDSDRNLYFVPPMEGLLRMVLDNNKRVQEAGCSAFATFEEDAGRQLGPFLEPILQNLVYAFEKYQQKNLLILYDALGTLADSVGDLMSDKRLVSILMPTLMQRWAKLPDDDDDLIPLLECLSSVTMACGRGFVDYAEEVFNRSVRIVHDQLLRYSQWQAQPDHVEEPDKTFIIVALDLLSGLTQGLGPLSEPLVQRAPTPLLPLVVAACRHPEASVRQSAYALIGDLAISVPQLLQPAIPELMPGLLEQIQTEPDRDFISACNNAAWSVGEIALNLGTDPTFQNWVQPLIERLIPILINNAKSPRSLVENAAVTIGRIALAAPNVVAPHLDIFAAQWCQALWEIKDNAEKDSAFKGFCSLIEVNPNGIQNHWAYFCNSVAKWNNPSPELDEKFRRIFAGFKQVLGDHWKASMESMPPPIYQRLSEKYDV